MPSLILPNSCRNSTIPVILIGAFDRHNFGDLLFPHIVSRLLQETNILYAGLKKRDLRPYGGHDVQALHSLARQFSEKPVHLLHAGGELLTCSLWEAAVMLLPAFDAHEISIHMDARPSEKLRWAWKYLEMTDHVPYSVSCKLFPEAASIAYNAVGGVDLLGQRHEIQEEVFSKLNQAGPITVRDRFTQKALESGGVSSKLIPDSAVMTAELFGEVIKSHSMTKEPAKARSHFPQGYIAVQFSNDFSDDSALSQLAMQLDEFSASSRLGLVLFRAGAAPWHDDLSNFYRLAAKLHAVSPYIFRSLHLWDICAVIAGSQAYCGSSLHGFIVAGSFARPRICIEPMYRHGKLSKHKAYISTWESNDSAQHAEIGNISECLLHVLESRSENQYRQSLEIASLYRQEFSLLQKSMFDSAG